MTLVRTFLRSGQTIGKLNGLLKLNQNRIQLCKSFSIKNGVCYNFDKSKLKYTEKHEWISLNGNVGTVGITDYAQDKLGEVVYVELPEKGASFEKSDQFATLESVKAVSECYMPVSGSVIEANQALKEKPSQINSKPFEDGWLVKINIKNISELDKLMNDKQYADYLKSEEH